MKAEFEVALLLIYTAGNAMSKRRSTEMMCGYPADYGGDQFILEKIREYLNNPSIKEKLKKLLNEL